jgi:hypothetical protein
MLEEHLLNQLKSEGRSISKAQVNDDELGHLKLLPGTWQNAPNLNGRGWNMIALPFVDPAGGDLNYRLLLNQYNEVLKFTTVNKAVPNRGIKEVDGQVTNTDQFVVTLDYEQSITQVAAEDFPVSGQAGGQGDGIHLEPGLFLQMANEATDDLEIARMASIPHGNSVMALGKVRIFDSPPIIENENGLPIGLDGDLNQPYLAPYKKFQDNPFKNLFNPVDPNDLLRKANQGINIARTTEFKFDTKFGTGGINNIPFIKRQADASEMTATFWLQELEELDENDNPKLRLQYTQTVMLDFFPRPDGQGVIKWPHVSINTLEKIG